MKILLALCAVTEAATGLALLAFPPIVIKLLFGAEIAGFGILLGRVAGIGLVGLGVACWPSGEPRQALRALLVYNLLVTLYFTYLGLSSKWVGVLLWPAVGIHAVLTILLAGAWWKSEGS